MYSRPRSRSSERASWERRSATRSRRSKHAITGRDRPTRPRQRATNEEGRSHEHRRHRQPLVAPGYHDRSARPMSTSDAEMIDVATLADLLHETADHHGSFE